MVWHRDDPPVFRHILRGFLPCVFFQQKRRPTSHGPQTIGGLNQLKINQAIMKNSKYRILMLLLMSFSIAASAQDAIASSVAAAPKEDSFFSAMTLALVFGVVGLLAGAMLAIASLNKLLVTKLTELEAAAKGISLPSEAPEAVASVQKSFSWEKFRKRFWEDAVPIERESEVLMHHEYDGIRELDNSLPPWWVNMFIITVVWAFGYMIYYHWGGSGPSSSEEYDLEIAEAKAAQRAVAGGKSLDENSVVELSETADLSAGATIFSTSCASCHGQKGEGLVGPNLTDEYWLHGGGIVDIFKVIKNGVPEKGMIAWSAQLTPKDIQKVASYIRTLKGTNPPNPKAPQGEIWQDAQAQGDSTNNEAKLKMSMK
jgi:cytochrome c oxidase cbb3-type subunit III